MRDFKKLKKEKRQILKNLRGPACTGKLARQCLNIYANLWRLAVCNMYKKKGFPVNGKPSEWNGWPRRPSLICKDWSTENIYKYFVSLQEKGWKREF